MVATETRPDEDVQSIRRWPLSHMLSGLAVVSAIGTMLLWWIGTWSPERELEVGREVFNNIPTALVALFYVAVSVGLALTFYLFALRVKNIERGASETTHQDAQTAGCMPSAKGSRCRLCCEIRRQVSCIR